MNTEISYWNGYGVNGDVSELNAIVCNTGYINLDKDDVVGVLSTEGDNWVVTATDKTINEAFDMAVKSLPFPIGKVNSLIIDFRCGNRQPNTIELSKIPSKLAELRKDIDVKWGISEDESLGENFKVVLLVSAKR